MRPAIGNNLALTQHDDSVRHLRRQLQIMRADKHAAAIIFISQKQLANLAQAALILSCRRLIKQQKLRLLRQHGAQNHAQALSFAERQRKILRIFRQVQLLQQALHLLLGNRLILPAQLLTHRICQKHQIRLLPQIANAAETFFNRRS